MTSRDIFEYCIKNIANVLEIKKPKETYLLCGSSYSYGFNIVETYDINLH